MLYGLILTYSTDSTMQTGYVMVFYISSMFAIRTLDKFIAYSTKVSYHWHQNRTVQFMFPIYLDQLQLMWLLVMQFSIFSLEILKTEHRRRCILPTQQ